MITKTDFLNGMFCPKYMYESKKHPEYFDKQRDNRLSKEGHKAGQLASELFDDSLVRIPTHVDNDEQVRLTEQAMKKGKRTIAEAAFMADDLFCRVDYLRVTNEGVEINEVKAATSVRKTRRKNKEEYEAELKKEFLYDFSFQYYVLTLAGYNIRKVKVIHLNKHYRLNGNLNIKELFAVEDVTDEVIEYCSPSKNGYSIKSDIEWLTNYLNQTNPDYRIGTKCKCESKDCEIWEICAKGIPSPNVFDLNGQFNRKRDSLYGDGYVSFSELIKSGELPPDSKGYRQVEAELTGKTYIEVNEIKEFLEKTKYPLYFLDFETFQNAIPEYDGQWPYEQIPFQYSLHYIEYPGARIKHIEFLAEEGKDPRRDIAQSLVDSIPEGVCVTAYNMSFERDRLTELAGLFPDLSERLMMIANSLVDFIEPFNNYWLYNKNMNGKSSIKYVLPALFPNEEILNYKNLPGVQRGDEAMEMFLALPTLSEAERKRQRAYMLRYCRLDTFAMIKIYEALLEAVEDKKYDGVKKATTKYACKMKEKDMSDDIILNDLH